MNSKNLILKNIIDTEPVLGAGAPSNSNVVKFAFTSNSTKIASASDGQILFSHVDGIGGSTGVIYVGDQIVSSKVLDASFVDADVTKEGKILCTDGSYHTAEEIAGSETLVKASKQRFTVKYVDTTANHAIVTASFDNVNPELAQAFVKAQAAADKERLDALDASVSGIETFIKGDVVTAETGDTNAAVVSSTPDTNGYKSYTVDVKVDNTTIQIDSTSKAIKAPKTLAIVDGATGGNEEGKKFIILKNAANQEESRIDVANLIGSGIVTSATYNPTNNKLTIVWATATGDQDTVIDLADLLDINDVLVKEGSANYIDVTVDSSVISIGAKVQDISTADETHTGLLDASTTKTWILDQLKDTEIDAEGDAYVVASIDANNNKKVNVSTNVADLKYTASTVSTIATLGGTANTLVKGAQAAEAITSFVNDRIDASISALDAERGGKDVNVSVGVTEVDGVITDVSVKETYATVTYVPATTGDNPTEESWTITTSTGLVTGNDINTLKSYVDNHLNAEDATVTVTENPSNYVSVTIAEADGKLTQTGSSLSVTYAQYGSTITPGIATDAYVTAAIQDLDLASTAANASAHDASSLVTVTISETDGIVKMESVAVKTIDVSSASADSDGLATAKAVKDALTWTVIS